MTEHITSPTSLHESDAHLEDGVLPDDTEAITPDDTELDKESPLLYPGVQRVMDVLKRIADENVETGDIEHTPLGEPILTTEIVNAWAEEVGFSHGRRGTFHNDDAYIYLKECNTVSGEENIDPTLATARHLTSLGAIHPESQWCVYQVRPDGYQLVVVSPKLEAWSLEENVTNGYNDRPTRPMGNLSHVEDWYKRIDPGFIPKQPIPKGSLLHHLNWTEASYHDNWGWDETGTLFPVDVEVLRPSDPGKYPNTEPWKTRYDTEYYD